MKRTASAILALCVALSFTSAKAAGKNDDFVRADTYDFEITYKAPSTSEVGQGYLRKMQSRYKISTKQRAKFSADFDRCWRKAANKTPKQVKEKYRKKYTFGGGGVSARPSKLNREIVKMTKRTHRGLVRHCLDGLGYRK